MRRTFISSFTISMAMALWSDPSFAVQHKRISPSENSGSNHSHKGLSSQAPVLVSSQTKQSTQKNGGVFVAVCEKSSSKVVLLEELIAQKENFQISLTPYQTAFSKAMLMLKRLEQTHQGLAKIYRGRLQNFNFVTRWESHDQLTARKMKTAGLSWDVVTANIQENFIPQEMKNSDCHLEPIALLYKTPQETIQGRDTALGEYSGYAVRSDLFRQLNENQRAMVLLNLFITEDMVATQNSAVNNTLSIARLVALLSRENASVNLINQELQRLGIPYIQKGGFFFASRPQEDASCYGVTCLDTYPTKNFVLKKNAFSLRALPVKSSGDSEATTTAQVKLDANDNLSSIEFFHHDAALEVSLNASTTQTFANSFKLNIGKDQSFRADWNNEILKSIYFEGMGELHFPNLEISTGRSRITLRLNEDGSLASMDLISLNPEKTMVEIQGKVLKTVSIFQWSQNGELKWISAQPNSIDFMGNTLNCSELSRTLSSDASKKDSSAVEFDIQIKCLDKMDVDINFQKDEIVRAKLDLSKGFNVIISNKFKKLTQGVLAESVIMKKSFLSLFADKTCNEGKSIQWDPKESVYLCVTEGKK